MKIIFLSIQVVVMFFFQACATKEVEVEKIITFPQYPQTPKILYLATYRGGAKEDKTSALDAFLGEKKSEKKVSNIIKPYGVGIQDGKLYVADTGSDAVFVIDEETRELMFIGNGTVGRLASPVGIAFDRDKNLYVSDSRERKINRYDINGQLNLTFGDRMEFANPTGIAIDKKQHRLYVVDTKAHQFKAYDIATKELLYSVGQRGTKDAEFNYPTNIAVDQRNGNIVVVDTQNFRVQIFDKDGKFITKFGNIGNKPGTFARPKGVGIDSDGNIYVADSAFNNVQIFDEKGSALLMFFGGGGYGPTQFRLITGVYIDENDKIIIADGFSGRVQTFQYISEKWKEKNPQRYSEITAPPELESDSQAEKK
ncbi:MAG: 6-bladed beta-propeller [Sulfurimonas sp.]|uniref:6-bladed beta-propeller n=1 Tax=Sulfurimonas sp. TaxID=2022749 RepID=UPI0025EB2EFE|nr:6-bladed beta-propeller [Sulfurimonas sp.]MCK9454481.1 6-bladed beta-propeller [Sulfurimonas sp.]